LIIFVVTPRILPCQKEEEEKFLIELNLKIRVSETNGFKHVIQLLMTGAIA
jgi:hypothetical protein